MDPISTSPLALQAFKLIQWLDKLIGPAEAQAFMLRLNDHLDGLSPVGAIKAGKGDEARKAVTCFAVEMGLFEEPWLPPHANKRSERRR